MKVSTPKTCASFLQRSTWLSFSFIVMMLLGSFFKSNAQFSIAAAATNYTQDFNTLAAGAWTDGTTLTGWYAKTDATASIAAIGANTGSTTTAGLYAFAVAGTNPLSEKALGYAPSNAFTGGSNTGKGYLGWRLINNTGAPLTSITVTWTGEEWRKDNTVAQSLILTYQQAATVTNLTAGTWTAAGSTFGSPIITAGASLLDGNAPANRIAGISVTITVSIPAGQEIMLRWEDLNDTGNDHFLAVDDVTINAAGASAPIVTTTTATAITTTGASSGGNVTANGGSAVTARGVAYGTSAAPTIAGPITSDGTGNGSFTSTLAGLGVNTQYFYRAYATNAINTSYGSESSFFTLANAPGTVTVNNATATSLDVTLAGGDGNPSTTEYAIQETGSGNYVQVGGSLGASPVWQTAAAWGTKTVTGLGVNTNNTFQAKARNGANVETAFGGSISLYTLANTPGTPTVGNPTSSSLDITITLNGNPGSTEYAIQETGGNYVQADGSLGASPVWQTAATWGTKTVTGLAAATLYTFQVKARNGNNVETAFGATESGMTNAANQPDLTETALVAFGNVCINTTTTANTFTVTGTDLTTADVTIGPLSGYSFSTDDITYTTSLTITQGGGAFSQLIYVKFSPTSIISYDGTILVGGGGAVTDNVAASGSGINTAPTVTAGAATNVTINSATIPGTITADGCSAITAYGAEYSINAGFTNGTGVQFPGSNLNLGSFSVDISVLNSGTQYYYHTYATNSGGTAYSSEGTFTTLTPALSTDALTAFGAVCINTTNAANTFTITGTNLSAADVTVATLNGFTYSTDDVSYFPSLTISQPGGAFSQLIYVKFSPALVQSYNGNIVVAGGGAANSNVAASGSGINTAPAVTTGSSSGVTQTTATLNGTITFDGCTAVTAYGIEYSTLNGFANGTGTQVAGGTLTFGAYSSALSLLDPGVTYYYKAYAANAGGTTYGSQQSFATSALDAPVATAATDNTTGTSFTANWNAVAGATSYRLDVSTSPTFGSAVTATDLFISEYVEGSSNNKYIEIYNGTGASVNLADYRLRLYANGSVTTTNDVQLAGTLANGAAIVYKNAAATVYGGTATNNGSVNYNGDDAVALFKISTASNVDIFGRIGEDPGAAWSAGGNTTLDKTLVRNPSVTGGVTVNPGSGFPTLATEWTQSNIDVVSNLGTHNFTTFNPSFVPGYNNLTVNGLSQSVTGLTPNTTYHYRVRAFSATSTSPNSNVIDVTTLCAATVTASAGANGTVIPTGATNYNCGDNAVYTITPNTCYAIADVIVDGVSQGAINTYTFTNITAGDHTISATFALNTFTVTASASAGGSITPSGASIVNCGDNISYTIVPAACNSIADVLVDGVSVGAVSSYSFNGVTDNHTISVNFILTPYTITVTSGVGGTVLPGSGTVNCGTDANYSITPDACYSIANVLVDGISVGAVPSFMFTNVTADHTISATFSLTTYTITASAGPNGSVTPAGASIVNCGTDNVYNITPSVCYHVDDVLVDGVSQGPITTYTFTNTVANHTISATFAINASLTAPFVTGPVNVCPYINTGAQIVYTASSPAATGYNWVIPPTNVTIISGQGTSTLTVTFQNGFAAQNNKQLRVTATSPCGNSPLTVYYLVTQIPSTPQPIVGNTNVCPIIGTPATYTYTISSVPGASEYAWTAQAGTTIISHPNGTGVNDTTVTVSFTNGFTSSSLTVAAANGCGTSPTRSIALTKVAPSAPGIISGPTNVCANIAPGGVAANYSVASVAGVTYTWNVPAGAIGLTGQGTASISFTYPSGYSGGTISVFASNGCGISSSRVLNVTRLLPSTPSPIDVIESQGCPARIFTYSLISIPANAVSVQWTSPAGSTILTGQGTASITVSYPPTAINGTITATAVNNCGSSAIRSVNAKYPTCGDGPPPPPGPRSTAKGTTTVIITAAAETMQVNVFPNPTISDFKLQVVTAGKEKINVRIMDLQGRELKQLVVMPYQTTTVGSDLKSGSYLVEVRQGTMVKTTKLIKF